MCGIINMVVVAVAMVTFTMYVSSCIYSHNARLFKKKGKNIQNSTIRISRNHIGEIIVGIGFLTIQHNLYAFDFLHNWPKVVFEILIISLKIMDVCFAKLTYEIVSYLRICVFVFCVYAVIPT